jgi:hypothetical protein
VVSAWFAAPRPPAEAVPVQPGGAAGWAAVFVALGLWELGAWLLQPTLTTGSPVPSFGALLRRVMGTRSGRVGVMVGWAWLGVHFLAR